jgi:hypothetical protein
MQPEAASPQQPLVLPRVAPVRIVDLGDRLRVTIEIPVEAGDHPSRRRALTKAWEALAGAISDLKATLPPMPPAPKAPRKRNAPKRPVRTGSGSWWQF